MNALPRRPREGSEKARIWAICEALAAETGAPPAGRAVVDRYVAEGGNEATGFTEFSRWKKAREAASAEPDFSREEPGDCPRTLLETAPDGTLRLPEPILRAMALRAGERVTARVESGELRIYGMTGAIRNAQRIAAKYKKPGVSIVDEFLAERRAMWGEE